MIECITTGALSTNSYIISNENNECIVVDPGLDYKKAYEYIKNKYKVKAILLTHGHFDHIDGLQYFMNYPIYIHKFEEEFLYDSYLSLYDMIGRSNPFSMGDLDIRLVHNGDKLNLIGYEFEVIHTPGHTKGSVCYKYSEGVLTGDTLFCGTCGRTDFPTGNITQIINSLKFLTSNLDGDLICYPGHENYTSILREKNNNPYLR